MRKNMADLINKEEIRHIAKLARLEINMSEEDIFIKQFSDILDYMKVLEQVDTSNTEPLFTPCEQEEHQRPDMVNNMRNREEILKNAPLTDGIYFIVPRIV